MLNMNGSYEQVPSQGGADANGSGSSSRPRPANHNPLIETKGTASIFSSTANLANTVIGAGLVAMPGAMKYTGLLPGIALIMFCGFTSLSGLYLLTRCAARIGGRDTSFYNVAKQTLPSGARWFDLAIALKCYGVSVSYLIICGQLMPQVMISFFHAFGKDPHEIPELFLHRDLWILLFMMGLTPLCFLRKLDSLRHTSYLSLLAVVYLVIIVLYYSTMDHAKASLPERGEVDLVRFDGHLVSIFPVFVFAFTCAQNVFPVYNELKRNTEERVNTVIAGAIGCSSLVYELVSICGYLTFGSNVTNNILASYPAKSLFVCGGRIAIVILTLFSYPLQVHPCRAAFDKVFTFSSPTANAEASRSAGQVGNGIRGPVSLPDTPRYRDEEGAAGPQREDAADEEHADAEHEGLLDGIRHKEAVEEDQIPLRRWCTLTGLILVTTFTISLFIDDLSIVLGFVGSVGSTTISFILPGVLYAVLHAEDTSKRRMRRFAILLAVWGIVVLVVTFSANLLKVLHAPQDALSMSHDDRVKALVGNATAASPSSFGSSSILSASSVLSPALPTNAPTPASGGRIMMTTSLDWSAVPSNA